MKYILYARKSTEEDDKQVLSIEAQLVELQEYAAKEKLEIVASLCEAKTAKEPGEKHRLEPYFNFGGRKFFMNPTHTLDEFLDLVDENDNVVGKKKRSEVYAEHLSNFRVVNAFVVNSRGEIWIPRRSADKRIFPLCLDMSMGGHVESGETYEDTLKRETEEELNIDTDKAQVRLLGHLSPQKDGVSANMNVYEIKIDEAPDYNKSDFVEYFWLTPKALFERIANGDKTKGDLPKLVKIFYGE